MTKERTPLGVRASASLILTVAVLGVLAATSWHLAGAGKPFSAIDEAVHADTQFKVHHGSYPFRGALMGQEVVAEWTCRVGHQSVAWDAPCGSPGARPAEIPTGSLTTGYIHYPTYFVGGEAFRRLRDVTGSDQDPLDTYRQFAAAMAALGVFAAGAMAWLVGLRRSALAAAAFAPVAAPSILVNATMVNPMSMATLCGALIAGTGMRWVLTGRGFWWLAAASSFGACVAVTASLPAGVFLLAILMSLLLGLRGWRWDTPWRPRWWHALVLAAILVTPIGVYGIWIDARATISDQALYASFQLADWHTVWQNVWAELFANHLPWVEDGSLVRPELGTFATYSRAAGAGVPWMLTLVVVGSLVAGAAGALHTRSQQPQPAPGQPEPGPEAAPPMRSAVALLTGSTLLGLLLYPPLLRLSNAYSSGIDVAIVSRYSISFAPLMVLLVLISTTGHPWLARIVAALSSLGVLAWCITAW